MAQNFDRMKDGYNRYQVDSAIEELNMRIDSLERVNEAYRLRCTQLEEQIRHLQNADVIISEALLDARELLADITHLAQETQDAKGTMQRQTQRIAHLLDEFETVAFPKVELPDKQRR